MSIDKGSKGSLPENKSPGEVDDSRFLRRRRAIREVVLDTSLPPAEMSHDGDDTLPVYDLDLSDKIKVIFINGRGNTGKTVFLRLNGEIHLSNRNNFVLAACDIGSRAARRYFGGNIMTPETNDLKEISEFIKDAIVDAAETRRNFLIDMGAAGETAILRLNPRGELIELCQELGVTPVFIHMIGTSVDDVSVLNSFEQNGLCPPATALIFNEMNVGVGTHRDTAFGLVRAQPCVRRAIERGAAVLRLPALDREIATEVEARELLFGDAGAGKLGKLVELGPLGPFDRSSLRIWRREALRQLSPIGPWLSWPPSIYGSLR